MACDWQTRRDVRREARCRFHQTAVGNRATMKRASQTIDTLTRPHACFAHLLTNMITVRRSPPYM
jgi:hypothetical protein